MARESTCKWVSGLDRVLGGYELLALVNLDVDSEEFGNQINSQTRKRLSDLSEKSFNSLSE